MRNQFGSVASVERIYRCSTNTVQQGLIFASKTNKASGDSELRRKSIIDVLIFRGRLTAGGIEDNKRQRIHKWRPFTIS